MITHAPITPCRGDYVATDAATAALKAAIHFRNWAATEWSEPMKAVLRAEMRYYARIAVVHARRFRRARS